MSSHLLLTVIINSYVKIHLNLPLYRSILSCLSTRRQWVSPTRCPLGYQVCNYYFKSPGHHLSFFSLETKEQHIKHPKSDRRNWSRHGRLDTGIGGSWVFNNNPYGASDNQ